MGLAGAGGVDGRPPVVAEGQELHAVAVVARRARDVPAEAVEEGWDRRSRST